MDKKKLPIGIDDFSKLIQDEYYYIDKTLLIEELLKDGAQVILLTRPRRFGKTLNMSMLKEFFSIEKDSKELFKDLKIMDTQYSAYINKYPVIFFSFRDCKGQKEELLILLKTEIFKEYKKYQFLREKLDSFDKKYFDMVTDELTNFDSNDFIKFNKSIEFLCRIISEYYKVNPVLLIDEYDTPMMSAYEYNYYEDVISFFTVLYGSALKGNVYLQKHCLLGFKE